MLDPEVRGRMLATIAAGATMGLAARQCGVSRSALSYWRHMAEAGEEPYAEFIAEAAKASAAFEARLIEVVWQAATNGGNYKASLALMEKRFPARYGKRAPIVVHQHGTAASAEKLSSADLIRELLQDPDMRAAAEAALRGEAEGGDDEADE